MGLRGWSTLLFPTLLTVAASAELKLVASVPLPCESRYQALSPKGDQVAVHCKDDSISLVSVASGATVRAFPSVNDYLYSPDGSRFAMARWDGTVEVVATAMPDAGPLTIKTSARPSFCAFSPDSATLVLSPVAGPGEIWDITGTPRKVAALQEDFGGVLACAFSPDGKLLVAASGDTAVRFYDTANWRMVHEYRGLKLESFAVAFTPDGKRILIGGPDSKIAEFDLEGNQIGALDKDRDVVGRILFLGKSGEAAVEYFDGEGRAPPHMVILNLQSGKQTPLNSDKTSAMDIVNGRLWLGSTEAGKLTLHEYQ